MQDYFERTREWIRALDPRLKILIGILFIVLGLLALVTPLTPGAWLVFVGLELLGFRIAFWRRFVHWFQRKKDGTQDLE